MGVYIIAEAGVNHNGDIKIAKRLVDMAYECGADAVKFQTFKAEESTGKYADKAEYQKNNMDVEESQFEMIKKLELPFQAFDDIQKYCKYKGIDFISTPDGSESLNCLLNLGLNLIKIGSSEITNLEFLQEVAKTGCEIILSTGMSYLGEVEKAVNIIKSTGNEKIKLMHCITDYPTSIEDVNLMAMVTMREAFKLPVGFSDHTLGNESAIAAVALGAEFIEKHITVDKNMKGPDHRASINKKELKDYVQAIRNTEKLLGDGIKKPTIREKVIMKDIRRSIVAKEKISKGEIIKKAMLTYKRPGDGIAPELIKCIIGRKINRDIDTDEVITWKDIF